MRLKVSGHRFRQFKPLITNGQGLFCACLAGTSIGTQAARMSLREASGVTVAPAWQTGSADRKQKTESRTSLDSVLISCFGVADGTRTHDDQNHNLGLYQLSYSHRRA